MSRKAGAAASGLVPVRLIAWHPEQFAEARARPRWGCPVCACAAPAPQSSTDTERTRRIMVNVGFLMTWMRLSRQSGWRHTRRTEATRLNVAPPLPESRRDMRVTDVRYSRANPERRKACPRHDSAPDGGSPPPSREINAAGGDAVPRPRGAAMEAPRHRRGSATHHRPTAPPSCLAGAAIRSRPMPRGRMREPRRARGAANGE